MRDYHYISSGEQTKMYTLRHKFDEVVWFKGENGKAESSIVERDWHIRNLSIDADKALEKAKALGYNVVKPTHTLEEITRNKARSSEEVEAAKLAKEERDLTTQRMKLEGEIDAIKDGMFPFGKYAFTPFVDVLRLEGAGYIAHFMKEGKRTGATSTMKFMSEYLIANFTEIASYTFYKSSEQYFGEVGGKYKSIPVTVVGRFSFESFYGYTTVVKFLTNDGELLTYMGSSPISTDNGDKLTINFTVKQHLDYRGEKQAKIIRIKSLN